MKKIIICTAIILINFSLTSCFDKEKSEANALETEIQDLAQSVSNTDEPDLYESSESKALRLGIPIAEGKFEKLLNHINSNGFIVYERGVPCDRQLTFFDSRGNRHALIAIKRNDKGYPSIDGTVNQISVWAYKDGIKDQDHFFSYFITKEMVMPSFIPFHEDEWKERELVNFGFSELLTKLE